MRPIRVRQSDSRLSQVALVASLWEDKLAMTIVGLSLFWPGLLLLYVGLLGRT